ncbi:MAG: prolipoprotein diacylglyceryl transferase family protein [Chloroflexota bacterium]
MLAQYTQIGFWSIPTFRLALGIAIVLSLLVGLYGWPSRIRNADVYLGALVLGIIGARAFHVALNWDYFTDNRAEIGMIAAGGLDWHGALLGGLLGLALVNSLQRVLTRWLVNHHYTSLKEAQPSFNTLLATLTPTLPLIGLGGWVGCLAAGCGYGKEVDSLANYPRWMTSELVDVFGIVAPRYNTPYFGIVLCLVGFLLTLLLILWRRKSPYPFNGRSFWWLLAFLCTGMFVIGFYRADHTFIIDGLRADQLLDVIIGLWALILALRGQQRSVSV